MTATPARSAFLHGLVLALLTGIAFTVSTAAMVDAPDVVAVLFFTGLATLIAWPLTTLGYYCAFKWVGVHPTPLLAAAVGRARLPPRAKLIPMVAVVAGVATLFLSLPVIAAASPLFEDATLEEHPFEQLEGPQLLQANLLVFAEEVVFRLGLMFPLLALLGVRHADRAARPGVRVWAAILISGVLFGLAHAPDAGLLGVDPFWYAVYSIVQKGVIGGGIFGYVAWRWGLEAAFLTHYAANAFAILLGILAETVAA